MTPNTVRKTREAKGLTQRRLADLAGTSQQQIQRIEAGVHGVRLELATQIADALGASLAQLFPALGLPQIRSRRASKASDKLGVLSAKKFIDAGIDPDPRHWWINLGLRDGQAVQYVVSSSEKDRISNVVLNALFDFLVFDASDKVVAVRRREINYCEFDWDVGRVASDNGDTQKHKLEVFFVDGSSKVFGVEPDTVALVDDEDGTAASQLQRLFVDLDGEVHKEEEALQFYDDDGALVYLRRNRILRAEIPLICCQPSLWDNLVESDDQDVDDSLQSGRGRLDRESRP